MTERNVPHPGEDVPRINGLAAAILGAYEVTVFENLYLAYASEARGVARAILGDADLAADAVHNGFIEMLRYVVAGRRLYDPADARGMVLRNVRWAALNVHRERKRMRLGIDGRAAEPSDDVLWARAEARALCEEIVGQLSASYQEALRLRYVEGLSNIEAAQHLGVSIELFESRIRRAIRGARKAARSTGLFPQIAALADTARRFLHKRLTVRRPKSIPAVKTLSAVMAASVAAFGVAAWTQSSGAHGAVAPPHRLVSAAPAVVQLDPIDNSLVLDALALPPRSVLALGEGRGCGCLVLLRSADAGATWVSAPGPLVRAGTPTLAVAAEYPNDPRIVVDPRNGQPVQVSPRFGMPFAVSGVPVPIARDLRHADSCGATTTALYCRGQDVATVTATGARGPGALLPIGRGRLIYFRRLAGISCSVDGGVSWGERCPLP